MRSVYYMGVMKLSINAHENRPLAAPGLISYRYPSQYGGYVMIGAKDDTDALNEAQRSDRTYSDASLLEVWRDGKYVSVAV